MDAKKSQAAFAALAQPTRLKAFRKLVAAHPDGLPAGEIAAILQGAAQHHVDASRRADARRADRGGAPGPLDELSRQSRRFPQLGRFHAARLLRRPAGHLCARGRGIQRRVLHAGAKGGVMKLYMFEHCSLCFRVRMMAALEHLPLQETVVRDDDSDTMVGLVGKRVIPILVKDDGRPMLESMDMVEYIDDLGSPISDRPATPEIAAWADQVVAKTAPLTMPRYPLLGLPEFATPAALAHYTARKFKTYGDFAELRSHTPEQIEEVVPKLDELDALIESPQAVNGTLSLDDIRVLPLLRSIAEAFHVNSLLNTVQKI